MPEKDPVHPKAHTALKRVHDPRASETMLVIYELLSLMAASALGYTTTGTWEGAVAAFASAVLGGGVHRAHKWQIARRTTRDKGDGS